MKDLESCMKAGRRVTLQGPDPAAVAEEWRDVAKRYDSALGRKNRASIVIQNYCKDLFTVSLSDVNNSR